jgi:hypothetical protein
MTFIFTLYLYIYMYTTVLVAIWSLRFATIVLVLYYGAAPIIQCHL